MILCRRLRDVAAAPCAWSPDVVGRRGRCDYSASCPRFVPCAGARKTVETRALRRRSRTLEVNTVRSPWRHVCPAWSGRFGSPGSTIRTR
jgi:hypothetical protein